MDKRLGTLRETLIVREAVRRSMRGNAARDTGPERALRKALWRAGLRGYRKNVRKLPGSPDVLFPKRRVAIFVHGCFWHGCPHCTRKLTPKTNGEFWRAKVQQNRDRDARDSAELEHMGYLVFIFWECELKGNRMESVVTRVGEAVREPRSEALAES